MKPLITGPEVNSCSRETAQLFRKPSKEIAELASSFFPPAARAVLLSLSRDQMPSRTELAALTQVTALGNRKLKGGYFCLGQASNVDGGNHLELGTPVMYMGKAVGREGFHQRVIKDHLVSFVSMSAAQLL